MLVTLLYGASAFITPYRPELGRKLEFYIVQKKRSNTLRATIEDIEGDSATIRLRDGLRAGETISLKLGRSKPTIGDQVLVSSSGDGVVILSQYISALWRLPGVLALIVLFIVIVFAVSGKRGMSSLAGLFISIGIIAFWLIPTILQGANAFFACIMAAFVIAALSITVAHGWQWRSIVSLFSIFIILLLTIGLAILGGYLGSLTGVYDDTSSLLQASNSLIDMRGVLIGGIVIATLGVLDDVITTQTAAIDELHKARPKLSTKELVRRGYSVGIEHVIAVVNTLALAYIGASLPIVLSIVYHLESYQSPLLAINSEIIAQEVVRTIVSSIALIVAIPVSTVIAALLIRHKQCLFAIMKRR